MDFQGRTVNNTNLLFTTFAYAGADGFRTGTTREAGFCLIATAYRDGRRIITVVMNAPDNPGRYGDTQRLLDFGFAESARRAAERINVTIDGVPVQFDVSPRTVDGRVMVPVRAIAEALGKQVFWNPQTNTVEISAGQ